MKKYLKIILRISISLGLILYLLSTQDVSAIKSNLLTFDFTYFFVSIVLLLLGAYVSCVRWKIILQTSKVNVSVWYLFALHLKGYFYNNFLPTQMGGDVYKSIALGKKIDDQSISLFSVFMHRFSGLLVLLVMALFGIGLIYGKWGILLALGIFVVGLILYFPVLHFLAKRINFIKKFKVASDFFVKDKNRGLQVLILSFLVQILSFSLVYVLFLGVDITLPLWSVVAYMPIISLSLLIPSFNGFGTQETVYAFLFSNVGVTTEISIAVSLMVHLGRLVMSLLGGILILFPIDNLDIKKLKIIN